MWVLHVDHIIRQWNILVCCNGRIYSGVYIKNVKGMYTSACGHILDCDKFICDIHTGIGDSYLHMN